MSLPTLFHTPGMRAFGALVDAERERDIAARGDGPLPDGTSHAPSFVALRDSARELREDAERQGTLTWRHLLDERYRDVVAQTDPLKLHDALIRLAAGCASWATDLGTRRWEVQEPAVQTIGDAHAVNAAGDAEAGERYPTRICVFCDRCGREHGGDYLVSDDMTKAQRLDVARTHLWDNEEWYCGQRGDFCPDCKNLPTPEVEHTAEDATPVISLAAARARTHKEPQQ